jgi:hypothetical protein
MRIEINEELLLEMLSDVQHEIWRVSKNRLLSVLKDGKIPKEKLEDWEKNCDKDYKKLTEELKEKDRIVSRKLLQCFITYLKNNGYEYVKYDARKR